MTHSARLEIRAALRQLLPVMLAVTPFGMVYGAVAVAEGLTLWQAMGFSISLYAGASQLAALQMIGVGAPIWSVLLTVVALNFRHVLYSASVGRHLTRFNPLEKAAAFFLLTDPMFGAAEARALQQPLTKTFYFAYGILLYLVWIGSTLIGAVFGSMIGDSEKYGLDFVLPVYFLSLLMTFRARNAFYLVASSSAAVSLLVYATLGPPWHVTIGGLAGVAVAALAPPRRQAETAGGDE
ncbi:MAG: AzlC family ABC transporter permease [Aurantimonas endophytica]|uniref:4-azaleucine resistance transporter AzlC n=1 Tax=Aurantimonas endophytica TaxID=1522175 RepID=A0A7W6HBQ3_9HYPH|nr:AzlC family ABC transporter permease [Aurantimonas endophytica]MBB4002290.1 4-azaleucine resistance transporter AzlC [Aurantimonas endophytica]MCO6402086.1 branched-chain amino acid ABC transporter permease [Aurantimonas endophytica]